MRLNPFTDIQLSIEGTKVTVQYKLDPSFKGQFPFTYSLSAYQDESFTEPLYTINSSEFFIVDDTNTRQNSLPSFLYKLSLTTDNKEVYYSNFFGWHSSDNINRHKYLLASEIARRERVRLNYVGTYAYLLKRQSYSNIVSADSDPITGEPIVDNTATYGVGMVGGYYKPVLTRVSVEGREAKTEYDQAGRGAQFTEQLSIRSVGFPYIDTQDIIVMPDSKRFIVTDSKNKYFPGTTIILLQNPMLRLVPNTDTIYNIQTPRLPNEQSN